MGFGGGSKAPDPRPAADAQRYAADKSYEATIRGQDLLQARWEQTREDMRPWVEAGEAALKKYVKLVDSGHFDLGRTPAWRPPGVDDFVSDPGRYDPGFAYAMREGEKYIRRQGARGGSADGGATLKALEKFRHDLANTGYDRARARSMDEYRADLSRRSSEQNRLNLQADHLRGLIGIGGGKLSESARYGYDNAMDQANLGIQGAEALGKGAVGAAQTMYQGQLHANQAKQQGFDNVMSIISLGAGIWAASDVRLKRDIEKIGEYRGLPVYEFRYLWDDTKQVGFMAHEVLKKIPDAVKRVGEYLVVDYQRVLEAK